MEQKIIIDFIDNATSQEAAKYILRFAVVILRNFIKCIDRAAHRYPWQLAGIILAVCVITSYVFIGQARAERDHYNKENYQLTQELSKYKAALGEKGGEQ